MTQLKTAEIMISAIKPYKAQFSKRTSASTSRFGNVSAPAIAKMIATAKSATVDAPARLAQS